MANFEYLVGNSYIFPENAVVYMQKKDEYTGSNFYDDLKF